MYRLLLVSAIAASSIACAPRVVRLADSLPAAVQLNLSTLPRVWVAGFVAGRNPEVDVNGETVRFLRRQLPSRL